MSKFGPQPINDAGKGQPRVVYRYQDEERIDRRPQGRVERFVDPQGNVVSLQLVSLGDPNPVATADRMRLTYRRDGFVEHAKCPFKHGTAHSTPAIQRDFAGIPADVGTTPCAADPKTMVAHGHGVMKTLEAKEACPHVEWLIADRRKREAADNEKRNANRIEMERRANAKAELEKMQLEEAHEQLKEKKAARGGRRKPIEAE